MGQDVLSPLSQLFQVSGHVNLLFGYLLLDALDHRVLSRLLREQVSLLLILVLTLHLLDELLHVDPIVPVPIEAAEQRLQVLHHRNPEDFLDKSLEF